MVWRPLKPRSREKEWVYYTAPGGGILRNNTNNSINNNAKAEKTVNYN